MRKTESAQALEFVCNGRTVGYVMQSSRSRSVRIVVRGPGQVEVRKPRSVSASAAQAFVEGQAAWILDALERQSRKPQLTPARYEDGATLFVLGQPLRLSVSHSVWRSVTQVEGELRVTLGDCSDAGRVKALVETWLKKQAEALLARCLGEALELFGARIASPSCPLAFRRDRSQAGVRLTVRAMRTRWGSCSRDGHVTLSASLVHLPRRLIDYVIVHELCHLAHLDHSAAFRFQLARCLPDWAQRRRELEQGTWQARQVQT